MIYVFPIFEIGFYCFSYCHKALFTTSLLCLGCESKSHSVMSNSAKPWIIQPMEFARPEYWSGQSFPSPEDLPNPGLPHCRQILYQLSHKGSPKILAWVAYPFSGRSSQPRNETGSLALQVDSLPTELSGDIHPF